jgi:quercetin dioxygenase-like cupin family protein
LRQEGFRRLGMSAQKKGRKKSFGAQMRALRMDAGISYEALASDTGCSVERLERIERNDVLPTVSEVIRISKALSVDPGSFLSAEEEEEAQKRKIESYRKRTEAYSYTPLTPGARTKHMKAFLVSIDPRSDHQMVEYQHEGEEFIYVLKGTLDIQIGDHRQTLGPGQSIHFNSAIRHQLRNVSEVPMELIVVVYTP